MLLPNTIPEKEPLIRVGIVLPEDQIKEIHVDIPSPENYTINSINSPENIRSKQLVFQNSRNSVLLDSSEEQALWNISPKTNIIKPKHGLVIKNVPSGRGFHWQKSINVYLPGSIEIRAINGSLQLINELPLEQYIMCVATSEMGSDCPAAFLEALTIAARSWVLANIEQKHKELGIDVCNDDCCQRYQGTGNLTEHSMNAAINTIGKVLMFENKICDARYSKSCGGISESKQNVWGGESLNYLKSIIDAPNEFKYHSLPLESEKDAVAWINGTPECFCSSKVVNEKSLHKYLGTVDDQGKYFRWQVKYSQKELLDIINQKLNINAKAICSFESLKRGESGRIVELKINYLDQDKQDKSIIIESEYEIRSILHKKFLYSSCIYFSCKPQNVNIPDEIEIHGAGWGHGVGLCQIGALGMAFKGHSVEKILRHYYRGSTLRKIY